jgi:hypothetical protein
MVYFPPTNIIQIVSNFESKAFKFEKELTSGFEDKEFTRPGTGALST